MSDQYSKLNSMIAQKIVAILDEKGVTIQQAERAEAEDGGSTFFAHPKKLVLLAEAMCDLRGWPRKAWLISALSLIHI